MTEPVNIHDAKTNLSKLIATAEGGESVVVARAGVPVAEIIGYRRPANGVTGLFGAWSGRVELSRFEDDDEEIAREFGTD